ncbi:MAG TPA: hypothetical protein VLL77_13295 [Anaerolineales bacterium]|nr:hypothetical protein [Anaerolineales bacterium]
MISLVVVFWMFIALFGLVGGMRGWARELLVTSALILGLFLLAILETYIVPFRDSMALQTPGTQVVVRGGLLVLLAFFGYQTPNLRALQPKMARERVEEILLGLLLGLLNGYLLVGSIWYFLHQAGYPTNLVTAPEEGSELVAQIASYIAYLPPAVLTIPLVYFVVGLVFVFIIVVFV